MRSAVKLAQIVLEILFQPLHQHDLKFCLVYHPLNSHKTSNDDGWGPSSYQISTLCMNSLFNGGSVNLLASMALIRNILEFYFCSVRGKKIALSVSRVQCRLGVSSF